MPAPSQLKIRAQAVKRLVKEIKAYEAEAEQQKLRVDKMIAEQQDEYEIKQQQRVLADSEKMIPDTQSRLARAVEDLKLLVVDAEVESDSEDYKLAQEALELASV